MHSSDIAKLRQYIEKIENLESEKIEVQEQISDIYKQARGDGFDAKIMKKIIKLKKMRTEERETEDMLLDTYMLALGLVPSSKEDG
ncbi:MAG: DUF2312 domain-containing protein [Holosporaceae bacterium]|jgi:uncharacterized protein (UPF0335 family)|nr:DUF2312 domain-containing protein [Holosporaceae bacterium]